jgi:hypothetical protein
MISLVLRNQQDTHTVQTMGVRTSTLLGKANPEPVVQQEAKEDKAPPAALRTVEVIRRVTKESMNF